MTVETESNDNSQRQAIIERSTASLRISPLPPPEDFAKYKEVMPDLPERIVKQFEEDSETMRALKKERQTANIALQKSAQAADIAFDRRSQWMAFVVIMAGLVGTVVLAYLDKDVAAVVTAIGTAAVLFKGVFSKTTSSPDKNSQDEEHTD